ncbi:MAG: DUF4112 domain-containing protein [Pirellulales bacterium]|nr:DUF4112 domain-containing protein [Pirellulales bacterium]
MSFDPTAIPAEFRSPGASHWQQSDPTREAQQHYQGIKFLVRLLDTAFELPVVGWRIGLDPIIGLIPGVGDALTTAISLYVVVAAQRLGAPRIVVARMLVNVLVDALLGAVPILGDVFDVWFKANVRNLALFERALVAGQSGRRGQHWSDWLIVGLALLAIGMVVAGAAWLSYLLLTSIGAAMCS